jgi:putative membrane protein
MEVVHDPTEEKPETNRLRLFARQLSWRMILVRLVVNGLTLILVAVLVPDIYFVDRSLVSVLLMAVMLGILNAFVKPIVQFLTLPFIFATYGLIIVLINTVILLLLAIVFRERFYVGRLVWAFVGGLVMGVVTGFLESLLGLNLPIGLKPQEEGGSAAAVSQTITGALVHEMASREGLPAAQSENVAQAERAEEGGEPHLTAAANSAGDMALPADHEEPPPIEEDGEEPLDEGDDGQAGDKQ